MQHRFTRIVLPLTLLVVGGLQAGDQAVCAITPIHAGRCQLAADHVYGEGFSGDERVAFLIYSFLIVGPEGQKALVDLGPMSLDYCNRMFRRYGFFRDLGPDAPAAERYPDDIVQPHGNVFRQLEGRGISPGEIDHIVFTHLHSDHHGMHDAKDGGAAEQFRNALLHVSAKGWQDNVEKRRDGRWNSYVDYAFSDFLLRRHKVGKVRFEDDAEVMPGLRTLYLGGHSMCSQAVLVNTAAGLVVITSDEIYLYEVLEKGIVAPIRTSRSRMVEALERLVDVAERQGAILLPLHEPLIWKAFQKTRDAGESDAWLEELRKRSRRAVLGFRRDPPRRRLGFREARWPSFRGLFARGVAEAGPVPVEWDVETKRNIRWRTPILGLGHSSPVVWGNRIYLTTAVRDSGTAELKVGLYGDVRPVNDDSPHRWIVMAIDRTSGAVLWSRTAHEGTPRIRRHPKSSHANSTPATDGRRVVTFFGSEGLYCYDTNGALLWSKNFGVLDSGFYVVPTAQWGFGSSPVLYEERVVVQCDVQKDSFLAVLDARTGQEVWRAPRDDVPTWSTPTVHVGPERTQILVNGYRHIGGYDFGTGKEIWRLRGGGDIPVPTPIAAHGLIYITNAHGRMAPIYAIRDGAEGDISSGEGEISGAHVAWSVRRGGNYMQTPIAYGDYLYCSSDGGILTCYRAVSGESLYRTRLGSGRSGFSASPVAADGRLFFTSEDGDVHVVLAGPEFKLLATNRLGEICMATPAIAAGELYFRTRRHLLAVAGESPNGEPDGR